MRNPKLFIKALQTLMTSWGGDTPPEAIWTFNELMDSYEKETGFIVGRLTSEEDWDAEYTAIIETIKLN